MNIRDKALAVAAGPWPKPAAASRGPTASAQTMPQAAGTHNQSGRQRLTLLTAWNAAARISVSGANKTPAADGHGRHRGQDFTAPWRTKRDEITRPPGRTLRGTGTRACIPGQVPAFPVCVQALAKPLCPGPCLPRCGLHNDPNSSGRSTPWSARPAHR